MASSRTHRKKKHGPVRFADMMARVRFSVEDLMTWRDKLSKSGGPSILLYLTLSSTVPMPPAPDSEHFELHCQRRSKLTEYVALCYTRSPMLGEDGQPSEY